MVLFNIKVCGTAITCVCLSQCLSLKGRTLILFFYCIWNISLFMHQWQNINVEICDTKVREKRALTARTKATGAVESFPSIYINKIPVWGIKLLTHQLIMKRSQQFESSPFPVKDIVQLTELRACLKMVPPQCL